ncbi:hypothetical protein AN958_06019 [Leucoagaricus sp. SymC.cos]|nr:hypothetical protein AN958_06019 [Leucoagaricus sp. SymC.cos]
MHSFIARASARPGFRLCSGVIARTCRLQSSNAPRSAWKQAIITESPVLVQENFPKHFVFVLDVGKRFIKFSFIGLVLLGIATGSAYEGAHIWAEKHGLAPDSDEEVKGWQWESDADKWTGDPAHGGTDPGLGFNARHLVRAAWMAYTWGIGHSTAAIGSHDQRGTGLVGPAGIKVINPQLQTTEAFLRAAIRHAESIPDQLYPHTLPQLFTLHGNVLEKLGSDFLPEAKTDLERAWAGLDAQGLDSARIALKLGDIVSRLGLKEQALEWWARALALITDNSSPNVLGLIPKQPPSSPLAQRLLSSTLVSLSAFYAKSGQYRMAESIEEDALSVLRAIPPPNSLASTSPPQALHALFLLQRSSILSIHLAEVLYAQRRPEISSIQWLTFAAESSERVARVLTGLPLVKSQEFHSKNPLPNPLEERLLTSYTASRSMKPVAEGLLRDARRTAAEAWNLMGVLHETKEGSNSKSALECFERAVQWAGTPSSEVDGGREAAEGIPDADWRVFWRNYQRALGQAPSATAK